MDKKSYVYTANASSPDYKKKLELIEALGIDPFARNAIEDVRFEPKKIILESDHWFVFENQHRYKDAQFQFVFVSQHYGESMWDFSPEAQENLFTLAKEICGKYNIVGGGFSMRFGTPSKSGATVKHFHAQLIVPEEGKVVCVYFGKKEE